MFVTWGVIVAARGSRFLLSRVPLAFICALIALSCTAFINGLRGAFLEIKEIRYTGKGGQVDVNKGPLRAI